MTQLENPWLYHLERDVSAMFLDTAPWDNRDKWELYAFVSEFDLIEDIMEYEIGEGEDPISAYEALPDKEAVRLIERYIESTGMIADFCHWRRDNQ